MKHIVLAIHGLGGRGAWFDALSVRLAQHEIKVIAPDLPGFGLNHKEQNPNSNYLHGHIKSYKDWLDYIQNFYEEIRLANPQTPITILGHSLGGVIASNLNIIHEKDNIILSVPGYKGAKSTFSLGFTISTLVRLVIDSISGKHSLIELPISNKDLPDPTDQDPLKTRLVSPNLLWQILELHKQTQKNISRIKNKLLMIQISGDQVVDNESQKLIYESIPSQNKTLKIFESNNHDWIWYEKIDEISNYVARWVNG